jgi:hypothetical protein
MHCSRTAAGTQWLSSWGVWCGAIYRWLRKVCSMLSRQYVYLGSAIAFARRTLLLAGSQKTEYTVAAPKGAVSAAWSPPAALQPQFHMQSSAQLAESVLGGSPPLPPPLFSCRRSRPERQLNLVAWFVATLNHVLQSPQFHKAGG